MNKKISHLQNIHLSHNFYAEFSFFCKHLSTAASAGMPLSQSLEILADKPALKRINAIILSVANDSKTLSFSQSLLKHPKVFKAFFIEIVHAGEKKGTLPASLNQLAEYYTARHTMFNKLCHFWLFLLIFSISSSLATVVLCKSLSQIPSFDKFLQHKDLFFSNIQEAMPGDTIATWISTLSILSFLSLIFGILLFIKNRFFSLSSIASRIPLIGKLYHTNRSSKICQMVHMLMINGFEPKECLKIALASTDDSLEYQMLLFRILKKSPEEPFPSILKQIFLLPNPIIKIIQIQEPKNSVSALFGRLAKFYEDETDSAIDALSVIGMPASIILTSLLTAIFYFAISRLSMYYFN